MTEKAYQVAELLRKRLGDFVPQVALVLGSGLGELVDTLENPTVVPYLDLPGFPVPRVEGHAGNLVAGYFQGMPVVFLQGRAHLYEGASYETIKTWVRSIKLLGATHWIVTNAAGSLRENIGPGQLVLLRDHINLQFHNPLTGPNDDEFGARFIGLEDAYDSQLRQQLLKISAQEGLSLSEGVYLAVLGPSFETPAEIKAFRTLGADLVGMSTVPEVIVARHCGMRVAAISVVTNLASGLSEVPLTHEETLRGAKMGTQSLKRLMTAFLGELALQQKGVLNEAE